MASVNNVQILGNVTKAPEVRYSQSGTAFCSLTVATNRSWKDKDSGEKREEAEFHRVVFSGRLAEIAGEYLNTGSMAYVQGRLKTRKWQDKEGRDTYTTEVIADSLQLFGQREGGAAREQSSAPRQSQRTSTHGDRPGGPKNRPQAGSGFDDMDDDIPF